MDNKKSYLSSELGKLPPQALDLEAAVLGAVMIEKDAINEVIGELTAETFYNNAHSKIWQAITDLHMAGAKIDLLTVSQQLKKNEVLEEVGGAYYIAQLTNTVASSAHIIEHAKILTEKQLLRSLISIGNEINKEAYNESTDPFALIDELQRQLTSIQNRITSLSEACFIDMVAEVSIELKEAASKGYISGTRTGSDALDRHTGGWQKGDLIIGGARPSMGKTTFTTSKALAQAKQGIPVAYVSLEVSSKAVIKKMLADDLSIDGKTINRGGLTKEQWQRFDKSIGKLSALPLHVYDSPSSKLFRVCAWIKKMVREHGVQMVYIDYLQLIEAENRKRGEDSNRDMSEISKALKLLAKELDIPIFALSQLSREVEKRSDKHPMLSDLRDSGTIEQNADVVMFFYRPEYYGINNYGDGTSTQGIAEVNIAKFRNGEVKTLMQKFEGEFSRFSDLDFSDSPF